MITTSDEKLSLSCFNDYIDFIHSVTGITIGQKRRSMVISRIRKRVKALDIENYATYLLLLKEDSGEEKLFIDLITTNETYFYRTPRIWTFIANDYLPRYYAQKGRKKLKIWSAASSTGEEAYTLGILCYEFKRLHPGLMFHISATDISPAVLESACVGHYNDRAVDNFRKQKPKLVEKYLKGDEEAGYQIAPEVKAYVDFKPHNLFTKLKCEEKYDLILLRNVLIYFSKADQEAVLANIHHSLAPDGCLIIGESESLIHLNTDFESIMPLVYRSKTMTNTTKETTNKAHE